MKKGKRTFLGTAGRFNTQRIVRRRPLMPGVREIHVKPTITIER